MSNQTNDPFDFEGAFLQSLEEDDKKKKEQEELEANRQFSNSNFEQEVSLGINQNEWKVIRIISNVEREGRLSTDCKFVLQSRILKDNGKGYIYVNWPAVWSGEKLIPDPEFILSKLMKEVQKGEWVNYTDTDVDNLNIVKNADGTIINVKTKKNGRWVVHNTNTLSYQRIDTNRREGDKYPPNFYPSVRVMVNILDRLDSWCRENKHSKSLSNRVDVVEKIKDDGSISRNVYKDFGISLSLYNEIKQKVAYRKGWGGTDIILRKYKSSDKWFYDIYDSSDKHKLPVELHPYIVDGALTPEEMQYSLYDLDENHKNVSYIKLKNNIKGLFKQADIDCGSSLYDELCALAKAEEEANKLKKEAEQSLTVIANQVETQAHIHVVTPEPIQAVETPAPVETPPVVQPQVQPEIVITQPVEPVIPPVVEPIIPPVIEQPIERPARANRSVQTEMTIEQQLSEYLPNYGKLIPEDVDDIVRAVERIDPVKGLIYKVGTVLLPCDPGCNFPNTSEGTHLPETVTICPVCGIKY